MNGLSMLVAMVAKWRHRTPVVMSEHGMYLRERYLDGSWAATSYPVKVLVLGFHRQLAGAGYLVADALAPHARHNRRWQLRGGADPRRVWSVHNGVEPADFPPADGEPAVPTIVYMGRIDPVKDLHTLIRAFAIVREEIPGARLRIFGDTSAANSGYRNSCLDLISELEIAGAATLEGRIPRQADAYHRGHVVALTSISEGFPYTVVEAMACGRPVVCTNVGGVAEAVGDAGLVVPARDHRAVARACVRLLRDRDLRTALGAEARRRVLENFTLASSLDAYRRIYAELAGGSAKRSGPARDGLR
jgi:glycosyltransferase involved in cell wall biosynthesis